MTQLLIQTRTRFSGGSSADTDAHIDANTGSNIGETRAMAALVAVAAAAVALWLALSANQNRVSRQAAQTASLPLLSPTFAFRAQRQVLPPPSQAHALKVLYPPGLTNLGNTCFMNSVLQALASLPSLVTYLHDRTLIYYSTAVPISPLSNYKSPLHVTEAMLDLAVALNHLRSSRSSIRPNEFINALNAVKKSNRRLLSFDQQDAHELLALVSGFLSDEEFPRPPLMASLSDIPTIAKPQSNPTESLQIAHIVSAVGPNPKIIPYKLPANLKNPLTGLMANIMTCMTCGYKSAINCAIFNNISLPFPNIVMLSLSYIITDRH
ncbi:Ubiquitin carboxyl-terminal hydrolase 30 [Physocladia obscura]|uniref:Ubiquitin carboxyl-terminal hydrolase 30 n=1 Tax=Physocladia obscura TaxID=109957 RepID=A0AAD5XB79_9FUNG|nr:Ubiquitin carboxyl-terminal hydrolase 30 [Physocladia obscura]